VTHRLPHFRFDLVTGLRLFAAFDALIILSSDLFS
jgi:hypothetical protein